MAAIRAPSNILCGVSYEGPLISNEGLPVTAIKITTPVRQILAQLPAILSTDLPKTRLRLSEVSLFNYDALDTIRVTERLHCSKKELENLRFSLLLASENTTSCLPIARAPLPELDHKHTVDITVHYDGKTVWPFVTFLESAEIATPSQHSAMITVFLSHVRVFTEYVLKDLSFDFKTDDFHDLIDSTETLEHKIGAVLKASKIQTSTKPSIDLSCPETLLPESSASSSQSQDVFATYHGPEHTHVIGAIIDQASALMGVILNNEACLIEDPDFLRLQKGIETFHTAVNAAVQRSPVTLLTNTYLIAEQKIKEADDAYDQALQSTDPSAIAAAMTHCEQVITSFNKTVNLLKKNEIRMCPTMFYKHMTISASTGLIDFNKHNR